MDTSKSNGKDLFIPCIICFSLTIIFFVTTAISSASSGKWYQKYSNIKTEAVEKGFAHWKVSPDGKEVEFIWNGVDTTK